jgi:hypothetical protein
MAGSRKPNPTHITRYERESYAAGEAAGKPFRWSHYDHGIKVPGEHLDEIRRHGFVRIEETHAERWGHRLETLDTDDERYRQRVERMAGDTGLAAVQTWTVGHIVWPGKEDEVCRECPYGSPALFSRPKDIPVTLHKGEIVLPRPSGEEE